ncbi:hypothetical protein Z043_115366 [Scleropages formosus]|uniref:Uncharacterized protein n=1 Tax=Scleropages formosus TaxID=113540 RepID=A0A0P7WWS3_SCLFO|nr:hypothetical protein Z043_115366 [Scleropages formosus]
MARSHRLRRTRSERQLDSQDSRLLGRSSSRTRPSAVHPALEEEKGKQRETVLIRLALDRSGELSHERVLVVLQLLYSGAAPADFNLT